MNLRCFNPNLRREEENMVFCLLALSNLDSECVRFHILCLPVEWNKIQNYLYFMHLIIPVHLTVPDVLASGYL